MSEALEQKVEALYRQLHTLREERDKLNSKAKIWAERRNRTHEEIRNVTSQIRDLRQRRNVLNEEVKKLKVLREATLRKRKEILEEIRRLREERIRMNAERPPRSRSYLEREIQKIEWKIQTEPLPLDMERRLVDQVRALEAQMEFYRRVEAIKGKIMDLRREAEGLKVDYANYRSKISEIAAQSQEYHLKMLKKIEAAKELKAKADEMHQRYLENREKARQINLEMKKILDEIRSIQSLIKAEEDKEKRKKESDLKRQMEENALKKLKQGEKLTFDEFKILLEKGLI